MSSVEQELTFECYQWNRAESPAPGNNVNCFKLILSKEYMHIKERSVKVIPRSTEQI